MAAADPTSRRRVFISYRRDDAAYPAGWLYDRLVERYGREGVFKDLDSIELGQDFVAAVDAAVASCHVLLAVIGPKWLEVVDGQGRRRLGQPEDLVRREIEAALRRGVPVIPVLVDGASMPDESQVPESIAPLVRRNGLALSPARFKDDIGRLIRAVDSTVTVGRVTTGRGSGLEGGGSARSSSSGFGLSWLAVMNGTDSLSPSQRAAVAKLDDPSTSVEGFTPAEVALLAQIKDPTQRLIQAHEWYADRSDWEAQTRARLDRTVEKMLEDLRAKERRD